jgi:hypothetical protein
MCRINVGQHVLMKHGSKVIPAVVSPYNNLYLSCTVNYSISEKTINQECNTKNEHMI